MVAPEDSKFHWADYLVFGISLLVAAGIGIFSAWQARKKADTAEFLLGSRQIGAIPTGLSVLASILNAVFVLSGPAEIYFNGTMFAYVLLGCVVIFVPPAHLTLPVFRRLNMISGHQYFELRFGGKFLRVMAACIFIAVMLGFLAAVLYMPALAFSQLTELPIWSVIVITGGICTFYTAIGGLKAVVWTDTLQMSIVVVGVAVIAVRGLMEVGGISQAFKIADSGNRLKFDEFNPDPRIRHSAFLLIFGWGLNFMTSMGGNQIIIQRQMAVKTKRGAIAAMYIALVLCMATVALVVLTGIAAYAFYKDCDPLSSGKIARVDQLIPLFMMQMLGDLPGLPGLFAASFFSAALSTVSSAVNSLSAVLLEDIIKPVHSLSSPTPISARMQLIISKVLALVFGLVAIGAAFVTPLLGPIMVQITNSVMGILGGPMLAMFLLGIFVPFANVPGVALGVAWGLGPVIWIFIGFLIHRRPVIPLPLSTVGCGPGLNATNITLGLTTLSTMAVDFTPQATTAVIPTAAADLPWNIQLYNISYTWYGIISVGGTMIWGIIFSLIFGCGKSTVRDSRHMFRLRDLCSCDDEELVDDEVIEIQMDKIIPEDNGYPSGQDNRAFNQNFGDSRDNSAAFYQASKSGGQDNIAYQRY